ncbi:hypothetical protein KIK06_11460 [Nocardiopsis sp. EMB25]|uniref:hypothetical protein n=1 Tax=Nocardiopsis sp. EMB25 TaxID=2835867 RepID=UPI002283C195|nr:hypothetical protein [Nocardiopsis sp. EMB25]MCY9784509.1 hypothetical protein [Nocardiopsis sp. EMB25]
MGRTGHHESHDEGEAPAKKRIDLSVSQVAGAGAATLTAATAASYLNVYGTVIGAAVIAVLSTVASPLLQHWFSRSGEQAKHLAERAVGVTVVAAPVPPPDADEGAADATRTMAIARVAVETDGAEPGDTDPTRTMALPTVTEDGEGEAAKRPTKLGWRAVLIPAIVVFTLVMLVILAFELFTGRSMTAWMNGYDEPTAPSILGGGTSAPPAQEEEPETPETTVDVPEDADGRTEGTTGGPENTGATEGTDGTGETGTEEGAGDGQLPVTPTPDPGDTGNGDTGTGGETTEPTPPAEGEGGTSEGTAPDGEAPTADDSPGTNP